MLEQLKKTIFMPDPTLEFLSPSELKVFEIVTHYHQGQQRKYTAEPYTNHLLAVARLAKQHIRKPFACELALCHDLFEDTVCDEVQLLQELVQAGYANTVAADICKGVQELTDQYVKKQYPALNRYKRKRLESKRLSEISYRAQSVKYCDMIDNASSMLKADDGFPGVYLQEMKDILQQMNKGQFDLYLLACFHLQKALLELREQ